MKLFLLHSYSQFLTEYSVSSISGNTVPSVVVGIINQTDSWFCLCQTKGDEGNVKATVAAATTPRKYQNSEGGAPSNIKMDCLSTSLPLAFWNPCSTPLTDCLHHWIKAGCFDCSKTVLQLCFCIKKKKKT